MGRRREVLLGCGDCAVRGREVLILGRDVGATFEYEYPGFGGQDGVRISLAVAGTTRKFYSYVPKSWVSEK